MGGFLSFIHFQCKHTETAHTNLLAYLTNLSNLANNYLLAASIPVMGPESSSEYFNIANGAIQSANSSAYLTVGSDSTSYKTLTLSASNNAPGWALEGDTIITSTSSSWGRQLNFLVCKVASGGDYWQVYLQTGSDVPSGKTCSNYQSLHLPCLC